MKTYALKIRGGAAVDKNGKKAGKGPLVAEDISHTIGTAQDQYIFQPAIVYAAGFAPEESAILDDQGGQQISIYENGIAMTLRAQTHGHPPNLVYCMETFHANVAIDIAGALRARDYKDPPIIIRTENADHVPVICIQGNIIDRSEHAGANGAGWKIDTCYTLNTIDRPAVVYMVKENDNHK